jgi:hypothetical protein
VFNAETGHRLTPSTVNRTVPAVLAQLGVANRAQVGAAACRLDLVPRG